MQRLPRDARITARDCSIKKGCVKSAIRKGPFDQLK